MGIAMSSLRNKSTNVIQDENEEDDVPKLNSHAESPKNLSAVPTRNYRVLELLDPRSPNGSINRTPILVDEGQATPRVNQVHNHPKTPLSLMNKSTATTLQGQDPRSPSQDIQRTPLGTVLQNSSVRSRLNIRKQTTDLEP